MNASLILFLLAALAVWVGWLYLEPFGRCAKCKGSGYIRSGRRRGAGVPRCKGRRRAQRRGTRTVHRLAFRIRDGQRTAAKYTQQGGTTMGIPDGYTPTAAAEVASARPCS